MNQNILLSIILIVFLLDSILVGYKILNMLKSKLKNLIIPIGFFTIVGTYQFIFYFLDLLKLPTIAQPVTFVLLLLIIIIVLIKEVPNALKTLDYKFFTISIALTCLFLLAFYIDLGSLQFGNNAADSYFYLAQVQENAKFANTINNFDPTTGWDGRILDIYAFYGIYSIYSAIAMLTGIKAMVILQWVGMGVHSFIAFSVMNACYELFMKKTKILNFLFYLIMFLHVFDLDGFLRFGYYSSFFARIVNVLIFIMIYKYFNSNREIRYLMLYSLLLQGSLAIYGSQFMTYASVIVLVSIYEIWKSDKVDVIRLYLITLPIIVYGLFYFSLIYGLMVLVVGTILLITILLLRNKIEKYIPKEALIVIAYITTLGIYFYGIILIFNNNSFDYYINLINSILFTSNIEVVDLTSFILYSSEIISKLFIFIFVIESCLTSLILKEELGRGTKFMIWWIISFVLIFMNYFSAAVVETFAYGVFDRFYWVLASFGVMYYITNYFYTKYSKYTKGIIIVGLSISIVFTGFNEYNIFVERSLVDIDAAEDPFYKASKDEMDPIYKVDSEEVEIANYLDTLESEEPLKAVIPVQLLEIKLISDNVILSDLGPTFSQIRGYYGYEGAQQFDEYGSRFVYIIERSNEIFMTPEYTYTFNNPTIAEIKQYIYDYDADIMIMNKLVTTGANELLVEDLSDTVYLGLETENWNVFVRK